MARPRADGQAGDPPGALGVTAERPGAQHPVGQRGRPRAATWPGGGPGDSINKGGLIPSHVRIRHDPVADLKEKLKEGGPEKLLFHYRIAATRGALSWANVFSRDVLKALGKHAHNACRR
ncbi:hypothetical protein Ate01nite_53220 [Actinoplanes teichomyceticus]|nr:hypothetical protein Ate01nite_53220 [Actinoplanes teichomyceticus]